MAIIMAAITAQLNAEGKILEETKSILQLSSLALYRQRIQLAHLFEV